MTEKSLSEIKSPRIKPQQFFSMLNPADMKRKDRKHTDSQELILPKISKQSTNQLQISTESHAKLNIADLMERSPYLKPFYGERQELENIYKEKLQEYGEILNKDITEESMRKLLWKHVLKNKDLKQLVEQMAKEKINISSLNPIKYDGVIANTKTAVHLPADFTSSKDSADNENFLKFSDIATINHYIVESLQQSFKKSKVNWNKYRNVLFGDIDEEGEQIINRIKSSLIERGGWE
jgi:hypothetical protein